MKNILLLLLMLTSTALWAQDELPERPSPQRLVNDYVGLLSAEEANALEQKLVRFDDSTSTQICIVIVDDLKGMDKSQYTTELAHKWGVGQKGKDNGIMIMVKPTGGQGERQVFIAVGYGLEGIIPDITAGHIVQNELLPAFKQKQFYAGLDQATTVIMQLASQEFTAAAYEKKAKSKSPMFMIIAVLVVGLIVVISRFSSARTYAHNNDMSFWAALMLMSTMNSSSRGSYGGFSSGSGGGGFGGFGGGGFGGGGAGGDW